MDRRPLDQLAHEPLYNTRAVAQATGVPADTFRAWERRYGLPRPFRTTTSQRLYSALDIGIITWLRDRTNEGMTISQAIQRLRLEHPREAGGGPQPAVQPATADRQPTSRAARLRDRLVDAAIAFDGSAARHALDEAIDLLGIETLADAVVRPALIEVDSRWRRGAAPVTAVRFASGVVQRRLAAIFALVNPDNGRGCAIVACAPGETHDTGALVVSILLAREGWRVVPLGPDVPASDLAATVAVVRPALVCLSATTDAAAARALDAVDALAAVSRRTPIAVGGPGFDEMASTAEAAGVLHVTGGAAEVVAGVTRAVREAGEW